jgi:hypothetical protein
MLESMRPSFPFVSAHNEAVDERRMSSEVSVHDVKCTQTIPDAAPGAMDGTL